MEYIRNKKRRFFQVLSLPVIWSVLFPLIIFDIWMEIYHRLCFPLYGIKCIRRTSYIKIDRHKLQYLKWYEKLGCAYCGYANGLMGYWSAIVSRTEKYWCGIMHKKTDGFKMPLHHKNFIKYGDEASFKKNYK